MYTTIAQYFYLWDFFLKYNSTGTKKNSLSCIIYKANPQTKNIHFQQEGNVLTIQMCPHDGI